MNIDKILWIKKIIESLRYDLFRSCEDIIDLLIDFGAFRSLLPENDKVEKILEDLKKLFLHFIYLLSEVRMFEILIQYYPEKVVDMDFSLFALETEAEWSISRFYKITDEAKKLRDELFLSF